MDGVVTAYIGLETTLIHADQLERDLFSMFSDNPSPGNIKINVNTVTRKTNLSSNIIID